MSNKNTDPIFEGGFEDFKIFLGDYVKNSVPELTKKYKDALGKCECCNEKRSKEKPLDTAHIIDRPTLIKKAFEKSTIKKDGDIHTVDLNIFCIYNKLIHYNYNNFHILCKKCHNSSHGKISKKERDELKNKGWDDNKINKEAQNRQKEFDKKMKKRNKDNIKKLEEKYQSNLVKILDECKNKLNTNGSEKLKEIIEYINKKISPQNI